MRLFRNKIFLFLTEVLVLLIFLSAIGAIRPVENLATAVLNPIFSSFHSLGVYINRIYRNQTSAYDYEQLYKNQKNSLNQLMQENAKLKIVEEENKVLREYLGYFKRYDYKFLLANIISRGELSEIGEKSEIIIIDKGKTSGVQNGYAIISSEGLIIGRIVEVKENISKAYLINNENCKFAATVLGQNDTRGVTEGDLGLTIKMQYIPQTKEIEKDDTIVTSGLEENIPRGLVIGMVIEINKESNELWQTATIESPIDFDNLTVISVIIP